MSRRKPKSAPYEHLYGTLRTHLIWHGARIGFLTQFLLAMLRVQTVNLAKLATAFEGKPQIDSHYKRLQRFLKDFDLDFDIWARLLTSLLPLGDESWFLTLDRTNWKFGKVEHNFLVLGITYKGIALPVFWSVLSHPGNSNTAERIQLMQRFINVFGPDNIAALLADREFVGEGWWAWLQANHIPFHIRIKRNQLIPNRHGRKLRADQLFRSAKPGKPMYLPGERQLGAVPLQVSALRLPDDFLIVVSSAADQQQAFEHYARRWEIETLFGCLKSRGFNLEDTHLTDPQRIGKLFALLALVFVWTYHTGEALDAEQPIPFKKQWSRRSNRFSGMAWNSFVTVYSTGMCRKNGRTSSGP